MSTQLSRQAAAKPLPQLVEALIHAWFLQLGKSRETRHRRDRVPAQRPAYVNEVGGGRQCRIGQTHDLAMAPNRRQSEASAQNLAIAHYVRLHAVVLLGSAEC